MIYSPRIKPIAKGGSTDVSKNYQSHKHHAAYWRPLQLHDLAADPAEQINLIIPAERAQLNLSAVEQRRLTAELRRLQEQLRAHLDAPRVARECATDAVAH